jgi:hypothetical protein
LETLINLKKVNLDGNPINNPTGEIVNFKVEEVAGGLEFDTKHFEIDSHKIKWGTSLVKVREILFDREKISAGSDKLEYKVSEVWGFEANKVKISADIDTGIVRMVVYDIAPLKNIREEKFYIAYIKHLETILGEPAGTEIENEIIQGKLSPLSPLYRQGYGICKAVWKTDNGNLEITLRVFGESKASDYGDHAADLQIWWSGEPDDDEDEDDYDEDGEDEE